MNQFSHHLENYLWLPGLVRTHPVCIPESVSFHYRPDYWLAINWLSYVFSQRRWVLGEWDYICIPVPPSIYQGVWHLRGTQGAFVEQIHEKNDSKSGMMSDNLKEDNLKDLWRRLRALEKIALRGKKATVRISAISFLWDFPKDASKWGRLQSKTTGPPWKSKAFSELCGNPFHLHCALSPLSLEMECHIFWSVLCAGLLQSWRERHSLGTKNAPRPTD